MHSGRYGAIGLLASAGKLDVAVHPVPKRIDDWVARLKLKTMGLAIDKLTPEQKKYLTSFDMGT